MKHHPPKVCALTTATNHKDGKDKDEAATAMTSHETTEIHRDDNDDRGSSTTTVPSSMREESTEHSKESPSTTSNNNDSDETATVVIFPASPSSQQQQEEEETWSTLRVLSSETETVCRTDECTAQAVVVWQSNHDKGDDDLWPLCEACQANDFGGWEDGMERPNAATKEPSSKSTTTKETETTDSSKDKGTKNKSASSPVTTVQTTEASVIPEASSSSSPTTDAEETWSTVRVLPNNTETVCRTDNCDAHAVVVWNSNQNPKDLWPLCESCQANDFGGWEEGFQRPVVATPAKTSPAAITQEPSSSSSSATVATAADTSAVEDEVWHCKKIQSVDALSHESPILCKTEDCSLLAAVAWVSNRDSTNWYSCLDCQEADFEGWPDLHELPLAHMTPEHMALMQSKCSKFKNTAMPVFPESPPKLHHASSSTTNTVITPLPTGQQQLVATQNGSSVAAATTTGQGVITPTGAVTAENGKSKKASVKPTKAQLEIHRKWQAAAEAAGGPGARIVLSKPDAKKIIFDFLYDSFAPMNITQIHTGLKAVVPSPILKACLDDMALDTDAASQFVESDEEEDNKAAKQKSAKKEVSPNGSLFKGSLSFKAGRGVNASLYYVKYAIAKNGDGLDPAERNQLVSNHAMAEAESQVLRQSITTMTALAKKLNSEPTNEEAAARLQTQESELSNLLLQVNEARKLKVNEKHKLQIKRRIDHLSTVWHKRRRICKDFLGRLEELTDGVVSRKICLAGNGQIECDSDEVVAKFAVAHGKKKRADKAMGKGRKVRYVAKKVKSSVTTASTSDDVATGIPPCEDFVAVLLTQQRKVERVHLDDD